MLIFIIDIIVRFFTIQYLIQTRPEFLGSMRKLDLDWNIHSDATDGIRVNTGKIPFLLNYGNNIPREVIPHPAILADKFWIFFTPNYKMID